MKPKRNIFDKPDDPQARYRVFGKHWDSCALCNLFMAPGQRHPRCEEILDQQHAARERQLKENA